MINLNTTGTWKSTKNLILPGGEKPDLYFSTASRESYNSITICIWWWFSTSFSSIESVQRWTPSRHWAMIGSTSWRNFLTFNKKSLGEKTINLLRLCRFPHERLDAFYPLFIHVLVLYIIYVPSKLAQFKHQTNKQHINKKSKAKPEGSWRQLA